MKWICQIMELCKTLLLIAVVGISASEGINGDGKCAARAVGGESVVCVCNATYCDTVQRQAPAQHSFLAYSSSQSGLRFNKTSGPLLSCRKTNCASATFTVDPRARYQRVEGFGGAATDAAGINWRSLSTALQQHLVDSYFSERGIEYSMVRVPVGGCDFSTRAYAYNELPTNDAALSNYSLSHEDYHYKLPLIKAGMRVAPRALHVVGTVWSPPPWMKTNNAFSGVSRLKPDYYQTYADYYYKFIDKYAAEGVPIWGITTTNEPTNGVIPLNYFNSLGWTAPTLGNWIVNHLGPTIRNSTYKDVKIIIGDDQRATLMYWISQMIADVPRVAQFADGVAVHYYTDFVTPAAVLSEVMRQLPGKFLLATEACEGSFPWQRSKVELGSWQRAHSYISDIITDLNHNATGWLDWNLCLDAAGGPNWAGNKVDSPIIVFPERDEFVKEPMFYALGHFSKWVPRGSVRVRLLAESSLLPSRLQHVAFITPRATAVVVLYNNGSTRTVTIRLGNKLAAVRLEGKSVTTVEIPLPLKNKP